MERLIHPTALISKKAKLAPDVRVGPYSVIEEGVTIGNGTTIATHCFIQGNTTIGSNCEIFSGACIGVRPQDLKFKGERSFLEIGNRNVIREYTTINPGTGEGGKTVIGDRNLIMAYSHIAHDCHVGSGCIIANNGTLAGHVTLEDCAMISGLSAAHQFVRIGKMAILGGCSKAVQDVPPFCMADGHPARIYGLNLIGMKRHAIPRETIKQLDRAYNIIFGSRTPLKKAAEKIGKEKNLPPEVTYLIEFIKSSTRGIIRSCRVGHNHDES